VPVREFHEDAGREDGAGGELVGRVRLLEIDRDLRHDVRAEDDVPDVDDAAAPAALRARNEDLEGAQDIRAKQLGLREVRFVLRERVRLRPSGREEVQRERLRERERRPRVPTHEARAAHCPVFVFRHDDNDAGSRVVLVLQVSLPEEHRRRNAARGEVGAHLRQGRRDGRKGDRDDHAPPPVFARIFR
jgi:hypothetical protein